MSRTVTGWGGALVFAALAALLIVAQGPATWALRLGDSDNFMRLQEVRDWLGGQSWWDIVQHRVDPGGGGLYTHWSRLADLPFAATLLLIRPFAAADSAERLALVVQPLLLLGVALWLQARIATALGGPRAALPAVVVGALATPLLVQFVPGRIDHHGLQIVLVLAATAALARAQGWRGGAFAALWCALSLNVGLETAPYLVVLAGFVAVRWAVVGAGVGSVTPGFALGLAIAVPLVFALTVPTAYWPMLKGDAVGRGHILLIGVGGGGLAALNVLARGTAARWLGLAGLAVLLLVVLRVAAAEVVAEPYRTVGPLLWRLWISHISETRSLADTWARSPVEAIGWIFFVATCAAAAAIGALWRPRPGDVTGAAPGAAALLALLAVTAVALAAWELRALALATAFGVPVAGGWVGRLLASTAPRARLAAAVAALMFSHIPDNILTERAAPARAATLPPLACSTPAALAALAALPRGLVLAPIDQGGAILALTHHSVVATPIHRDVHGNRFAFKILLADPAAAHALLAGSGVTYIAWCPGAAENRTLAREAPAGLLARLMRDEPIGWLEVIPRAGGLAVYRLRQPG